MHRSAGGIIVGPDGRVVVVNQNNDSWSLPKGRVEAGETTFETAKREIYEETGILELKLIEELGSYIRPTIGRGGIGEDTSQIKELTFYLFTTTQTDLQPQDPDNPEAIWLEPEFVEEKLHHPKDKDFFRSQLSRLKRLRSEA